MNFDLTEEQRMWRQTVHDFCDQEVKPLAAELDETEEVNLKAIEKMGPLGLLGMAIEEEYGGSGVDNICAAIAIEELGWACGGTALSIAAHNSLCCAPFTYFGTHEQKQQWLPKLASGKHGLGSLALTEPGAGSDLTGGVRTRAEHIGDEWVINGSKAWITNASLAPVIVVLCRTDPKGGTKSLSMILVPGDTPGVHVNPTENKMGVRASPTNAITFDDVHVPYENLLGEEGRGLHQTLEVLDGGRIGIGALSVGLAQRAFEEAIQYAKEREAFGRPIGDFQGLQFKLADAAMNIEAGRLLILKSAWLKDQGKPYTKEAAMGKLFATEMAEQVCRDAIQVLGSYGYSKEYHVERTYRDARLMTIGEGTSEVQRMVIGRRILK
jgi:alkylation response protein AidB-like acyl-CoA dehydrogenase